VSDDEPSSDHEGLGRDEEVEGRLILETPMVKSEMDIGGHHHLGANYSSMQKGFIKLEGADEYPTSLGKRVNRSLMEDEDEDSDESSSFDETNGMVSAFAGDAISNIMGMKPFRSVIKRYWTEEEVTSDSLNEYRTRN
jgi:hypothetical protein